MTSLQEDIKTFYDSSSALWERIWGEHMHHGYYGPSGQQQKDRYQAQIDLIEALLSWGGVTQSQSLVDVGCGIGGSTLYLAEKLGATAVGITLSPVQANRAQQRAEEKKLEEKELAARFEVADALAMPFPDQSFDLVWSLESGEHMPDKAQFVAECYRVLKPGGTFLMAAWCHRPTEDPHPPLTAAEQAHLDELYQVYCLPYIISLPGFAAIARDVGFQAVATEDWSDAVAPFWGEVIRSAFSLEAVVGLLQAGPKIIQAALAMRLMSQGYERGLVKFGVLRGRKGE
ncbi:MAG: methyltransferase domain-containing protein [Cyanobacteria bacterium P01_A01_bin.135]